MNSKWLHLDQYKKIVTFFGKKVLWLFLVGLFIGLAVYIVEVAFAYSLQSFLKIIGVMDTSIVRLPWWVPEFNIYHVLLFFFLVGTFRAIFQWAQLYLQGLTAEELRYLQRKRLLRWAFHSESVSSSQIITLLNDRTNSAATLVQQLQVLIVQLTCGLLLGVSLLYMEPILTSVMAVILILLLLPVRFFDRKIRISGDGLNFESSKINQQLLTSIKNLLLMQIYGTQTSEETKAQSRSDAIRSYHLVYYANNALKFALPQFIGLILICIIALTAKSQIHMTPGKLVSYFYLFVRFLQTISSAAQAYSPIIQFQPQLVELAKWWADHSFDGLRNKKSIDEKINIQKFSSPIGWNVENISFRYPGTDRYLFKNLTFHIAPGSCFVITGPSGVGKSTLLNLLIGGIIPSSGKIILLKDNQEKCSVESERQTLLNSIGYVGAESFLIEGTILDNLSYGLRQAPSEQDILDACQKAECQFIFDLPLKLKQPITEQGQGLSAGQKQRISLARALLRKPKVLLLDEATANLDINTEHNLVETLRYLKEGMTIIAITHRQALLKIATKELKLD